MSDEPDRFVGCDNRFLAWDESWDSDYAAYQPWQRNGDKYTLLAQHISKPGGTTMTLSDQVSELEDELMECKRKLGEYHWAMERITALWSALIRGDADAVREASALVAAGVEGRSEFTQAIDRSVWDLASKLCEQRIRAVKAYAEVGAQEHTTTRQIEACKSCGGDEAGNFLWDVTPAFVYGRVLQCDGCGHVSIYDKDAAIGSFVGIRLASPARASAVRAALMNVKSAKPLGPDNDADRVHTVAVDALALLRGDPLVSLSDCCGGKCRGAELDVKVATTTSSSGGGCASSGKSACMDKITAQAERNGLVVKKVSRADVAEDEINAAVVKFEEQLQGRSRLIHYSRREKQEKQARGTEPSASQDELDPHLDPRRLMVNERNELVVKDKASLEYARLARHYRRIFGAP